MFNVANSTKKNVYIFLYLYSIYILPVVQALYDPDLNISLFFQTSLLLAVVFSRPTRGLCLFNPQLQKGSAGRPLIDCFNWLVGGVTVTEKQFILISWEETRSGAWFPPADHPCVGKDRQTGCWRTEREEGRNTFWNTETRKSPIGDEWSKESVVFFSFRDRSRPVNGMSYTRRSVSNVRESIIQNLGSFVINKSRRVKRFQRDERVWII